MTDVCHAVVRKTFEAKGECDPVPSEVAFPIDALPEPIGEFSTACAASLSAPVEMVAIPALVIAAAAIGNSRAIQLKEGWTEPAAVFAAVVSPSGTMKTPALKMAASPLQELDGSPSRTWTSDVTVERLGGLLAENPRGLLLLRDELSAWVKSMNQYKAGGNGSDRQFYLSVWAGVPVKVDRKGQGEQPKVISVIRPCLSIVGGIPPDVVSGLEDKGGDEDGFLPRILFSWPEPVPVRLVDQVVPDAVRQTYADRIKQLVHLPFEDQPAVLLLEPDAHDCFKKWHDLHCEEMEQPGFPPFLRAAHAKFRGYCARLALIHAVTQKPSSTTVTLQSVMSAIRLINYFKTQSFKVMPLLTSSSGDEVERCKQEIIRKVSVCRTFKKRDLQKNSAFKAETFNAAFDLLSVPFISTDDATGFVTLYEPTNRQLETPYRSKVALLNSKDDGPDPEHGSVPDDQKILS